MFPMNVEDFRSLLPIAVAVMVVIRLYYAISGRRDELLNDPSP